MLSARVWFTPRFGANRWLACRLSSGSGDAWTPVWAFDVDDFQLGQTQRGELPVGGRADIDVPAASAVSANALFAGSDRVTEHLRDPSDALLTPIAPQNPTPMSAASSPERDVVENRHVVTVVGVEAVQAASDRGSVSVVVVDQPLIGGVQASMRDEIPAGAVREADAAGVVHASHRVDRALIRPLVPGECVPLGYHGAVMVAPQHEIDPVPCALPAETIPGRRSGRAEMAEIAELHDFGLMIDAPQIVVEDACSDQQICQPIVVAMHISDDQRSPAHGHMISSDDRGQSRLGVRRRYFCRSLLKAGAEISGGI